MLIAVSYFSMAACRLKTASESEQSWVECESRIVIFPSDVSMIEKELMMKYMASPKVITRKKI